MGDRKQKETLWKLIGSDLKKESSERKGGVQSWYELRNTSSNRKAKPAPV